MITNLGKVFGNDGKVKDYPETCDLIFDDYIIELHYLDEKIGQIKLDQDLEYSFEFKTTDVAIDLTIFSNEGYIAHFSKIPFVEKRSPDYDMEEEIEELVTKIATHLDYLNELLSIRKQQFAEKIDRLFKDYEHNNNLNRLAYNFIVKAPDSPFIDYLDAMFFESILADDYPYGSYATQAYQAHGSVLKPTEVLETVGHELDVENINYFYNEYFKKLTGVFNNKINFNSEVEAVYFTWKLLMEQARHYYYNQFNNNYGTYFNNVDSLSLSECLYIFCKIDTIDSSLAININIFTYFLMGVSKFEQNDNFLSSNEKLMIEIEPILEEIEFESFESSLLSLSIDDDNLNDKE